ncbi:hypothetical protein Avbf_17795, partial [Armadillidium vulgare]
MDMKCEEEFKVELVESTEEDDKKIDIHLEQLSTLDIQERNCYESIDVKSEMEMKEESYDFEEEETTNDKLFEKISTFYQNQ